MAYSVNIEKTCYAPLCNKKATQEVFNNFNGYVGFFCAIHANSKVAELNKLEKEDRIHARS